MHNIQAAEVVLPCSDLDETLAFFTDRIGFRVDAVFPADDPAFAVISGHGLRIRLQRGGTGEPGVLRLLCADGIDGGPRELIAPNGTRIEIADAGPPLALPPVQQELVLCRMRADAPWAVGRAGMRYRDLIPGRLGGRFIASQIGIPDGGPVPDYLHYHRVRFQMIFCCAGWVRVAYEDQGEPLVLSAGDSVLQPPQIRHRVLECSPGLEVVEISCPAEHETRADHDLALPTPELRPAREFDGQRFVHDVAADATWAPWRIEGFEHRETGIGAASRGLAGARVARPVGAPALRLCSVDAELLFVFVLRGAVTLHVEGHGAESLGAADCFVVPAGREYGFADCSSDLELLEVSLPADVSG